MFLLKEKADNKLYLYVFAFSLLLLFGCCSGKNNVCGLDVMNPNLPSMKSSIGGFNVRYSASVVDYWDDAVERGFLANNNLENFDPNENNSLERGLGYIFFNTLRARLSNERGVRHSNLQIWQGGVNNVTGFVCPKPWKYKIEKIRGREYGCFYLDCVQMGEYFYGIGQEPTRNFDKIYNEGRPNGRAPYMKVYYTGDNDQETSDDAILNVDHLLKDNSYLIELPRNLHELKTSYLDPFITFRTQTNRNDISASDYWRNREDYVNVRNLYIGDNNLDINPCICGGRFQPLTVAGNIIDHSHDDNNNNQHWKTNWVANMMRNNVV